MNACSAAARSGALHGVSRAPRRSRPILQQGDAKSGRAGCAGSRPSAAAQNLDVRRLQELSPPNLTNGMSRRVSSTSSAALWCV